MNAFSSLAPTFAQPLNAMASFWFEKILHGQRQGRGCLPYWLGLDEQDFAQIIQQLSLGAEGYPGENMLGEVCLERGALRQDLLEMRRDEWQELRDFIAGFSHTDEVVRYKLPEIVAAGCLGGDHLWRDLGFVNRQELTDLLNINFPQLAERNTQDMKWKKFFYKQLCEREGGYVCRSPSCETCAAYDDCFGSEE